MPSADQTSPTLSPQTSDSTESTHDTLSPDNADAPQAAALPQSHPIPPPTQSLQYRAVGLIQAKYLPSAEQPNQGTLITSDGILIDAAVLGRLMSLIRNHLAPDNEYLWVVYPRTRAEDPGLHVQMVGVWAPKTLYAGGEPSAPSAPIEPDYFSVRGEVVYQHQEEGWVMVKVVQKPKKPEDKPRFIKLKLDGTLNEKAVKTFWSFEVKRIGEKLVIQQGQKIASFAKPGFKKKGGSPKSKFHKKRPPGASPHRQGSHSPTGSAAPKPKPKPKGASNQ